MTDWTAISSAVSASFLASFVEVVEAFTIILAVATVRGWRPALLGAGAGILVLVGLVVALGPLFSVIPLHALQFAVGILLLLFGMRWLRKAILRSAGIIPLHDEATAFAKETDLLRGEASSGDKRADAVAMAAAFKAVVLEGVEVVFIVLAVGAGHGMIGAASLGALAAGLLVLLIGVAVHRPLARVPENTLKFVVGVMLSAFGTFWTMEGLGAPFPGGDPAILAIAFGFAVIALGAGRWIRHRRTAAEGS